MTTIRSDAMNLLKCYIEVESGHQTSFIDIKDVIGFTIVPIKYQNQFNGTETKYTVRVFSKHLDFLIYLCYQFESKELAEKYIENLTSWEEIKWLK